MGRGNYYRGDAKSTTADYFSVKLADMKRLKVLSPGWHSISWSRNGKKTGSISFTVEEDAVTFRYQTKDQGGNPLDVTKPIRLTRTGCHYGGARVWFLCGCGKRVARLFIHRQHVACRHCFNLAYPSQNDGCPINRGWAKIDKLKTRLGGNEWFKPKGMHQRTFDRLRRELTRLQIEKDEVFCREAARRFPGMEF